MDSKRNNDNYLPWKYSSHPSTHWTVHLSNPYPPAPAPYMLGGSRWSVKQINDKQCWRRWDAAAVTDAADDDDATTAAHDGDNVRWLVDLDLVQSNWYVFIRNYTSFQRKMSEQWQFLLIKDVMQKHRQAKQPEWQINELWHNGWIFGVKINQLSVCTRKEKINCH